MHTASHSGLQKAYRRAGHPVVDRMHNQPQTPPECLRRTATVKKITYSDDFWLEESPCFEPPPLECLETLPGEAVALSGLQPDVLEEEDDDEEDDNDHDGSAARWSNLKPFRIVSHGVDLQYKRGFSKGQGKR